MTGGSPVYGCGRQWLDALASVCNDPVRPLAEPGNLIAESNEANNTYNAVITAP